MVEPEIPQNTGNVARTCAATGARLHLVEPMGFKVDNAKLKRAGLDYWPFVKLEVHELKEIVSLMRRTSNNVNQIARRLNETGRIYEADITDVHNRQEQLWDMLNSLITKLSGIA